MGNISSRSWELPRDYPSDMIDNMLKCARQAISEMTVSALSVTKGNARIVVTVDLVVDGKNQSQSLYIDALRLKVAEALLSDELCLAVGYNGLELFFHEGTYRWGKKNLYLTGKEKLGLYEHFVERKGSATAESRLLDKKLRKKFGPDFPSIL